jgi:hypothetical protein
VTAPGEACQDIGAWLDEQCQQAREAVRAARGMREHEIFHASAMARYVALRQVRELLMARRDLP